jgi:hypothetical protein
VIAARRHENNRADNDSEVGGIEFELVLPTSFLPK